LHCAAGGSCAQLAFLRATLGAVAIPCPTLNVGNAFPAILDVALGSAATPGVAFSPYTDDVNFLLGALAPDLAAYFRAPEEQPQALII
jgi:hypothetical protein